MKSDIFITDGDALTSLTVLSNHPIFSAFSTTSLIGLISDCTVNTYHAGEAVVNEGDLVDAVFFVLEGHCEVRKHTVNALDEPVDVPIATIREEECIGLGEVGLFSTTGSRTATVVALSATKALCLSIKTFRLFLKNHLTAGETFSNQLDMLMRMHFIKSVAPFASISNQHIREIALQIEEKSIAADTTLFEQGDPGDACYIITTGKAEISRRSGDGKQKVVATLGENAIFGESALLMDAPRNATVRIIEPTKVLTIDKSLFNGITHQHVDAQEASMRLQLKRCKPLKLDQIDVYTHKNADGDEVTILKNTALGHYTQLCEQGLFLWNLLDGELSLNEIALHFFRQFNLFHVEDIASQIISLHNAGFIALNRNENAISSDENKPRWVSIFAKLKKIMEYRVLIRNADDWVGNAFNRVRRILYSPPALLLWMLIVVAGLASFVIHFERTIDLLASSPYKWALFLLSVFLTTLTVPLHELAHAFTIKHYGRKVLCFSLGWFWFSPFAYCETSDMWLSSRKQRAFVDLAGVYLNAILAGLAGVCIYFLFPVYPNLTIVLELFALSSYLFMLIHMNSALELDGYYALVDGLDKPDLRLASIKWACSFQAKWESVIAHYKEVTYCLLTLIYVLVVSTIVSYAVFSYLLAGLFGVSNPVIAIVMTLIVVSVSLFSLYKARPAHPK